MKFLKKPDIEPNDIYEKCIAELKDDGLRKKLNDWIGYFSVIGGMYERCASSNSLFHFISSSRGNSKQYVFENFRKDELIDLYDQMVSSKKDARKYYNSIFKSSSSCPYCWFGEISTLDHFMAKAYYPTFSVLPVNLVPSCYICNKGRKNTVLKIINQIPHPYFPEHQMINDDWLFADIFGEGVVFNIKIPVSWDNDLGSRVSEYFKEFNLGERWGVQASGELADITNSINDGSTSIEVLMQVYSGLAQSERLKSNGNLWKIAFYEALVRRWSNNLNGI